jgi:GNAT superfamily N-acetyltransferase
MTDVALPGGARIVVRPIRASDRELLVAGFEQLSARSRYQRFLAPMDDLPDAMVRYLTEVDHHDHEAVVAIDPVSGRGVGVARFVRLEERPDVAEAAVTVVDDWQGRGLGMALTSLLAERALEEGIHSFTALLLSDNQEMKGLLASLGSVSTTGRDGDTIEVEVPLHADKPGAGRPLYGLLRTVASRALQLARPPWRHGPDDDG